MTATNDTGPLGGTADIDYAFSGFFQACDSYLLAERNRYIHECRLRLFESFGAVLDENGFSIAYWRPAVCRVLKQVMDRMPIVILAGYMSRERGRHWKR